jgi:hypothetical protein
MDSFPILPYVDIMFSSNNVIVAKVKAADVFVVVSKNSKNEKDSCTVTWYYNGTNSPDIRDEYPFVDVLDLVKNDLSEMLLFNINLFVNKGV